MARKRTIDPDFWTHEKLTPLSKAHRLLYLGMISLADDYGNLKADPLFLKLKIFPLDPETIEEVAALRDDLAAAGVIRLYEVDGEAYLNHPKWDTYQKVGHLFPPKYPSMQNESCSGPVVVQKSCRSGAVPIHPATDTNTDTSTDTRTKTKTDTRTKTGPETDRESEILDELAEIRGLEPKSRAARLEVLRRAVSRHPRIDHLRVARELRDWFDCGNGAGIRRRTMSRYTTWIQRVASDPARAQEYAYDPLDAETEAIKRRVRAQEAEGRERERQRRLEREHAARARLAAGSGGGTGEDSGDVGVDRPGEASNPGSGEGDGGERSDDGVLLPEVQSLVEGVAQRMGRR